MDYVGCMVITENTKDVFKCLYNVFELACTYLQNILPSVKKILVFFKTGFKSNQKGLRIFRRFHQCLAVTEHCIPPLFRPHMHLHDHDHDPAFGRAVAPVLQKKILFIGLAFCLPNL